MKKSFIISITLAIILVVFIAYIDTRPHWNDDGISVLMVLTVSFICGSITFQKTWLIALAVGIWLPLFNIILANNFGSFIVLLPAFIGAYTGFLSRKVFLHL